MVGSSGHSRLVTKYVSSYSCHTSKNSVASNCPRQGPPPQKISEIVLLSTAPLGPVKKNKHVFLSAAYFRKLLCNSVEKGLVLLVVLPRRGRATENGKLLRLPIQTKHKKIFAIWTDAQVWTLEQVAAKPKLVTECGSSASKCSSSDHGFPMHGAGAFLRGPATFSSSLRT